MKSVSCATLFPARVLVCSALAACLFFTGAAFSMAAADPKDAPLDWAYEQLPGAVAALKSHCLGLNLNRELVMVKQGVCPDKVDVERLMNGWNQNIAGKISKIPAKDLNWDQFFGDVKVPVIHEVVVKWDTGKVKEEKVWWDGNQPDPRKKLPYRVLTLEGVHLYREPDAASGVVVDKLGWFEAFGVLDSKKDVNGHTWYQVAEGYVPPNIKPTKWQPRPYGWIQATDAIPWDNALAMKFTPKGDNRKPALFFKGDGQEAMVPQELLSLTKIDAPLRRARVADLRNQAEHGQGGPILGEEPDINTMGQKQLASVYPIMDFYPEPGENLPMDEQATLLLKVAARVDKAGQERRPNAQAPVPAIDIVFVVDTTESMQPYLDQILANIEQFVRDSASKPENNKVRFGLVAYRDKAKYFGYGDAGVMEYTPELLTAAEFVGKLKEKDFDGKTIIRAQEMIRTKEASLGESIEEAVFNGVEAALNSKAWRGDESAKLIVLVGDAPNHYKKSDPDFDPRLNIALLLKMAQPGTDLPQKYIYSFPIKNNTVKDWQTFWNEEEKQFCALATYKDMKGNSHKQCQTLDPRLHNDLAAGFYQALNDLLHDTVIRSLGLSEEEARKRLSRPDSHYGDWLFAWSELRAVSSDLPEEGIKAWSSSRDLENPGERAMEPYIVLNETQLRNLINLFEELKEAIADYQSGSGPGAEQGGFFKRLVQTTNWAVKDPGQVSFTGHFQMPAGLERLPYTSPLASMKVEDFNDPRKREEIIGEKEMPEEGKPPRGLMNKLKIYQIYLEKLGDTSPKSPWKKLNSKSKEDDRVIAIPVSELP